MSSVWCLIIEPDKTPYGEAIPVPSSSGDTVGDLKKKVKVESSERLEHVDPGKLSVWRCTDWNIVFDDTNPQALKETVAKVFAEQKVQRLRVRGKVDDQKLEEEILLILLPETAPSLKRPYEDVEMSSPPFIAGDDQQKRRKMTETREQTIEHAKREVAPSSGARMPAFKEEQARYPILNGRPYENAGLPIGLYHECFNTFRQSNEYPTTTPSKEDYAAVERLFQSSAQLYPDDDFRSSALDPHFEVLLGIPMTSVIKRNKQSDRAYRTLLPDKTTHAFLLVREDKNEIGQGGSDPSIQGALSAQNYCTSNDGLLKQSRVPTFILAIAGPWMCILGAVLTDRFVVQPLTDYVWIGGDRYQDWRLAQAARVFTALKDGLTVLRNSYLSSPSPTLDRHDLVFPYVRSYGNQSFTYYAPLSDQKPIFKAKLDSNGGAQSSEEQFVVVKFVQQYNAHAQKILSDCQLAPELLYDGTDGDRYGGLYMVVMKFVPWENAAEGGLSDNAYNEVRRAIKTLHAQNIVFGDLRKPNILVSGSSANLVDFDWCGTHGEGRYPISLNDVDGINWHAGVCRGGIMDKEHDEHMLSHLRQ